MHLRNFIRKHPRSLCRQLNREIPDLSPLHAVVPLALISCFMAASKWIDFRLGHDSTEDCIAITLVVCLTVRTPKTTVPSWTSTSSISRNAIETFQRRKLVQPKEGNCGAVAAYSLGEPTSASEAGVTPGKGSRKYSPNSMRIEYRFLRGRHVCVTLATICRHSLCQRMSFGSKMSSAMPASFPYPSAPNS